MVPQKPSGQPERIEEIRNGVYKLEAVTAIQKPVRHHQSDRFFAQCHIAASLFSHKVFLRPLRMTIGGKGVIMRETLIVIRSECEGSATMVRESVRYHQGDRLFASCHIAAFLLSHTAFLPPLRMTIGGKGVIMRETLIVIRSECEGSAAMVRESVRRHQSDRFFALYHIAVSLLSHKAFLRPLRMTIGGKGVIMRETLIVILNECEGSATMVRESVKRHQSDRFFALYHIAAFLLSHKAFLRLLRTTLRA